jgi:hypothetical protein
VLQRMRVIIVREAANSISRAAAVWDSAVLRSGDWPLARKPVVNPSSRGPC